MHCSGMEGESDRMKGKKRKNHFITTFLSSYCMTTLPGPPAEKKRHSNGVRVQSVFVERPQLIAYYYGNEEEGGMSDVDINDNLRQYCLGIEEAMRTRDPWKRILFSITGMWEANSWSMTTHFSEKWKQEKNLSKSEHCNFVRYIILGGMFSSIEEVVPQTVESVTAFSGQTSYDPYVHTIYQFSSVGGGTSRQHQCVLCISDSKGKKRTLTSHYCGLCATTAVHEDERKPTKHAY